MRNRVIVGVVALLMATMMMACAGNGGTSPTTPTSTTPPSQPVSVSLGVVAPQPDTQVSVGGTLSLTVSATGGGTGISALAVSLVREDGGMFLVHCISWSGNADTLGNIYKVLEDVQANPNGVYAWAKGHTLDALGLSATGVVSNGGCYFLSNQQDIQGVAVEKAQVKTPIHLGWKVI